MTFGDTLRSAIVANLSAFQRQEATGPARSAAVAFAIIEDGGSASFLLTRRALHLTHHPGQFALPGGRIDPGESAAEAALREMEEEVGVRVGGDAVLGCLDDFTTRSGFAITPVVLWVGEAVLHPDPREVHAIFRVPLVELDRDDAPRLTEIPQSDRPVLSMPLFGDYIYAPTAVFLYQFREVALRGQATRVDHYEQPLFAWR